MMVFWRAFSIGEGKFFLLNFFSFTLFLIHLTAFNSKNRSISFSSSLFFATDLITFGLISLSFGTISCLMKFLV